MTKTQNIPFYWGASTSAFQVEGAIHEGGKGLSTADVRKVPEGVADSSVAADHYHHCDEDIALMAKLGLTLYRFSFCWSRIMSDGKHVNPEGLAFYDHLVAACLERGITPFPTLYHFEMPQSLIDKYGGWKSRECIEDYAQYAKICFEHFKGRVKLWGTINEQLIVSAASDLNGNKEKDPHQKMKDMYQMSYHMSLAEKRAMALLRNIDPSAQIGPVCSMQVIYPETPAPKDILAAHDASDFLQNMFLDMSVNGRYPISVENYLRINDYLIEQEDEDEYLLKNNHPDFIGINYYASTCIRALEEGEDVSKLPPFYRNTLFTLGNNSYLKKTKWMEFGIDPEGLYIGMREIYERYHLPLMVTENGLAYSDKLEDGQIHDDYRIDYLRSHIQQCLRFKKEGYPIMGYCPWSLIDVLSSHQGYSKRYGLIYIDRTDTDPKECKRIPKDSYYWYANIIKNKGEFINE